MKQTFLPEPRLALQRQKRICIICCVAAVVLAAGLNILLTVIHTRQTHTPMMILNIVIDLIALWFVAWAATAVIIPLHKLLRLEDQKGQTICGTVDEVSENTERYLGYDCRIVSVSGQKVFVVENGTISLQPGETVTMQTVSGIVREVQR